MVLLCDLLDVLAKVVCEVWYLSDSILHRLVSVIFRSTGVHFLNVISFFLICLLVRLNEVPIFILFKIFIVKFETTSHFWLLAHHCSPLKSSTFLGQV